jgi:prevent-host-death family protein
MSATRVMPTRISQRELRNDNAELMRRVEAGDSFTVTRRGEPVADLIPHQPGVPDRRRFVPAADLASILGDLPAWDAKAWAAEQAELDEAIDDSAVDPVQIIPIN